LLFFSGLRFSFWLVVIRLAPLFALFSSLFCSRLGCPVLCSGVVFLFCLVLGVFLGGFMSFIVGQYQGQVGKAKTKTTHHNAIKYNTTQHKKIEDRL
jgi:hypothetical protein